MKNLIGKIWKALPWRLRISIIRLTQTKFTVSVIAVVFNERNEVLLLDHWLRVGQIGWALPGGFICRNEQPEDAVKREIYEETGLKISNVKLLRVRTRLRHIEIIFRAEASGAPKANSTEIRKAEWFAVAQIPDGLTQAQKDFIREAMNFS